MLHDASLAKSGLARTSPPDPMIRFVPGQKILREVRSMRVSREDSIGTVNITHAIVSVFASERTTFQGTG